MVISDCVSEILRNTSVQKVQKDTGMKRIHRESKDHELKLCTPLISTIYLLPTEEDGIQRLLMEIQLVYESETYEDNLVYLNSKHRIICFKNLRY